MKFDELPSFEAKEAGGTVPVDGWDELVDPMARLVESVVLQGLGSPAQVSAITG